MPNVKVVNEEEFANIMINLENTETFDICCAFINVGTHPEFGRVIGVSGDEGKSALILLD
jgi:hypothetical protein